MANVNADYEAITSTANLINTNHESITQILTQLKTAVDSLVSGQFKTDLASGAFQSSYEQFNTGVTQTLTGLHGMSAFLKQAQSGFESLDSSLSQAASQLNS
ncbi:WXG100 family type VII secretion target [Gryllotalpicola ginsengisoli]|uniref:WXG100 family type VII secretion target n=1 Tax=Gryllotalpicola ginsengisoli TaxID=444608 RepID=UPI0003B4AB91|nr:WXG100 family type VII secretion target [Gryllotalpicola ginsengisoli]